MFETIPIHEADARIRAAISPLPPERVPLAKAIGRKLLEPLVADRDLPPYDRSMMDGITFSSDRLDRQNFLIDGLVAAGDKPPFPPADDRAFEIMTGAPVPADCDTVVPVEQLAESHTAITGEFEPGRFIHRAGTDARQGQVLVEAGTRINAPEIAIAASVGQTTLNVSGKPRIGILSTGDEAVDPDSSPEAWQIRRSNGPALAALLEESHFSLVFHEHADDEKSGLSAKLDEALATVDLLIICGGISKGKRDFVRELLEEKIGKPEFHGVSLRPGKPMAFWSGPPAIFALPGNPVSLLATFARFVRPAISLLQGLDFPIRKVDPPSNTQPLSQLTWLVPVVTTEGASPILRPPKNSGDYVSIATSTGVVEIPMTKDYHEAELLYYYPYL